MDYLFHGGDFNKYDEIGYRVIYGKHPDTPLFSIMIPTYKRPGYLRQAVACALGQKGFDDYEVIVVDNDATEEVAEETYHVISSFDTQKMILYRNDENIGIYGNTLRAAKLSKGKYIVLLNDDDLLHPYYLKTVHEFIKKYDYRGIVGSQPYEFTKDDFVFPDLDEKIYAFQVSKREFFFGCSVTSPGLMYPKEILEDIYNAYEELLMGDQIIQYKGLRKYGMTFINFPLAAYRVSDNATLKDNVLTDMTIHMCRFREQTSQDDVLLKIFMNFFKDDYFCWYIDSTLCFWKKRKLRKSIVGKLGVRKVRRWSLKRLTLEDLILRIHKYYAKKHAKVFDYVEGVVDGTV